MKKATKTPAEIAAEIEYPQAGNKSNLIDLGAVFVDVAFLQKQGFIKGYNAKQALAWKRIDMNNDNGIPKEACLFLTSFQEVICGYSIKTRSKKEPYRFFEYIDNDQIYHVEYYILLSELLSLPKMP